MVKFIQRFINKVLFNIENKDIKKKIISLGYKPIQCEGCGEGWAEYSIKNPNSLIEDNVRWKVCIHCVGFYDIYWSKKRLYKDMEEDFRG